MAILSLPNELLLAIGEQQCLTRTDHWSLVLVSKSFSTIFMRVLYKEVRLKFPQRDLIPDSCPLSSFALGDPILQAILERLDSNPRLKACVRKCQIDNLICWNRPCSPTTDNRRLEWMLDPLFTLIGQLIHLKSICLYHSSIPAEWMLYLARQPSLKLIELSDTDVYNEPSHDGSFNIVALSSSGRSFDFFIRTLTFSGALVQLCLPNIPLQALTIAYSSSKGPILKALKSFAIGVFGTEGFRFFACTPNLTRLEFMDKFKHPYIPQYVGEWGKVLPKLETIRCQSILLSLFTRGRPVTSISVDQGNFYGILAMPKYFGSDVPVRKFHAEFCDDVPQLLAYIVANNSEIEELAVLYRKLSHTSCKFCILPSLNANELYPTLSKTCGMS